MKTAVIDIGSNSVRYALLDEYTVVAEKQLDSTVLADGLFFSGKLSPEAIERTVRAVYTFVQTAKEQRADRLYAFATEAVRAASNGQQFVQAVKKRCGIDVDVLSGEAEAEIGFSGATSCFPLPVAVFDMGGASCEIVCGKRGVITYAHSFPIGCVRLRDGSHGDRQAALALIENALPGDLPAVKKLIGIGGTATSLGGMLHCPHRYDPHTVHDSTVPACFLQSTVQDFFDGKDMQAAYPSLSPARARIIGYGALAALHILQTFHLSEFTVSERDNIEGYAEKKAAETKQKIV